MPRKPLPKNVTVKQQVADIQAGKSERAGHAMIKRNPPKVSVGRWLRSKIGLGPPKAETDRQKKIREALESAKGATGRTVGRAASRAAGANAASRAKRRPATRGGSRR